MTKGCIGKRNGKVEPKEFFERTAETILTISG